MNSVATSLVIGIADNKKADIDALTEQVNSAAYEVIQMQAVVTSLTAKSVQFSEFLAEADANKTTSLTNFNLAKDALSSVKNVLAGITSASKQTSTAANFVSRVSSQMAVLINKLIFSAEIIDKLTQLMNKQKSINSLIPDDLIKYLTKATTDANTAVASSLTALTACYATEATALEANSMTEVELTQVQALYDKMIVGFDVSSAGLTANKNEFVLTLTNESTGVMALLKQGYDDAVADYQSALNANNMVTQQLQYAQANLDSASIELSSLQAGLAAATAAAYAA